METHDIHPSEGRKEISCSDCGFIYFIAPNQRSSHCVQCGNIEYFAGASAAPNAFRLLTQGLLEKRVQPRLEGAKEAKQSASRLSLSTFQRLPDGQRVEELRMTYQVEWQLWSMLVKNFADPAFHAAYLCQATITDDFDHAVNRYREHRLVMAALDDERWQAEVADIMLGRLEALAFLRMEQAGSGGKARLQDRLGLLMLDLRVVKAGWLMLGLIGALAIFRRFLPR